MSMELGNLIFGHSRGNFEVPRTEAWYNELVRLFDAIDKFTGNTRDTSWRDYGIDFTNKVFETRPYYWGDCNCGYEQKEWEWCDRNKHTPECYQTEYHLLPDSKKGWGKGDKAVKALCKKHRIEWNKGVGSAVHCSCDYQKKWVDFCNANSHSKVCQIVLPNFYYKPTGFELRWYKYPLRDSYMSHDIGLSEFKRVIDGCIASLG